MKLTELQKAPLADYGATLPRDYPERFRSLLRKAFQDYRGVLNAAQLRELAGGGSPNTAQKAISDFLEEIQSLLAFRLPGAAPRRDDNERGMPALPESLQAAMSQLTLDAWRLSWLEFEKREQDVRRQAQAAIDAARAEAAQAVSEALAAVEVERQARTTAETEVESQRRETARLREREQQLDADLRSTQTALQEMQTALARAVEQTEEHHRHLAQAHASLERLSREHVQALLAQQRDHQAELREVRDVVADLRNQLTTRSSDATTAEAQAAELRLQIGIAERDMQRLAEWIDNANGALPTGISNPAAIVLTSLKRRFGRTNVTLSRRNLERRIGTKFGVKR